ncbi:MAG: alpha/beta hydrolase [Ruminococcus sp.]|nr:alpha/beta hydrolase [Ruminococcus sp.]
MWILITVLIILLLYIILIVGPSVVAYFSVFGRKTTTPLSERKSLSYYEPFVGNISFSTDYLSKLDKQTLTIEGRDKTKLCADLYDGSLDKTAICVHGYASGPDYNFAVQGEFLHRQGFNILLVNQRGHDRSGGKNICFGLKEQYDVLCWIDKVREITGNGNILLYGISMGGATVGYASDKVDKNVVKAMIIDCAFTSPYNQLKHDHILRHVPWRLMLPIECLLIKTNLHIDIKTPVADSLRKTQIPAFFIHGENDTTVPPEQGRLNYDSCGSAKQFYLVKNGNHTVSFIAGGEKLQHEVKNFINKYF